MAFLASLSQSVDKCGAFQSAETALDQYLIHRTPIYILMIVPLVQMTCITMLALIVCLAITICKLDFKVEDDDDVPTVQVGDVPRLLSATSNGEPKNPDAVYAAIGDSKKSTLSSQLLSQRKSLAGGYPEP